MCHEPNIPCKRVQCRPLDAFLSKTYTTRTPAAQKHSFGIKTTRNNLRHIFQIPPTFYEPSVMFHYMNILQKVLHGNFFYMPLFNGFTGLAHLRSTWTACCPLT